MNEKANLGNTDDNSIIDEQIQLGEEKSETIAHKDSSLKRLDISFLKHIELGEYKKSNILAYWIKDFAKYHDEERTFKSNKLKRYKRGDIIKANLGFNVGNELGGLHYCVVINSTDNLSYGTLNIIPLSSKKDNKKYSQYNVDLGNELYSLLDEKLNSSMNKTFYKLSSIEQKSNYSDCEANLIKEISAELEYIRKLKDSISKMKSGSIALVPQITTISKQRIYNPKSKKDILSGIKLSNKSLDLIDKKIMEMFTK